MGRCVAGQTKTFGIELGSVANAGKFQVNPTLDAADFRISINGGAFAALTNTPTVTPSGGAQVQVILAAAETTSAGAGGRMHLRCSDSSGAEWQDLAIDLEVFATAEDTLVATVTNLTNAPTAGDLTAAMKASINTEADTALTDAALATAANLATLAGYVDTEVAAIKAKTDLIPASPAATGDIPSAVTIAAADWAYILESGKTAAQAMLDIWATRVGDASSNSAATPTSITYDSPDGTVQVTHTHTTTSRTLA